MITSTKTRGQLLTQILLFVFFCLSFFNVEAQAAQNIGEIAKTVTDTFTNVGLMIVAASYITGLGFAIGAIMKFKQHKDNPTQIPIGTPIALMFIAAALVFLPSIFGVTGATIFGAQGGVVGGPTGTLIT